MSLKEWNKLSVREKRSLKSIYSSIRKQIGEGIGTGSGEGSGTSSSNYDDTEIRNMIIDLENFDGTLQNSIDELNVRVERHNDKLIDFENADSEFNSKISALEIKDVELGEGISALESVDSELRAEITDLKTTNVQLRNKITNLENKIGDNSKGLIAEVNTLSAGVGVEFCMQLVYHDNQDMPVTGCELNIMHAEQGFQFTGITDNEGKLIIFLPYGDYNCIANMDGETAEFTVTVTYSNSYASGFEQKIPVQL